MPYVAATFDDAISHSMRETADRLAAGSAFKTSDQPFHVPIMGSLQQYSPDAIAMAAGSAPSCLRGRFVKWELHQSDLRCVIEFSGVDALLEHLQQTLPRGKPWRTHYLTLGSIADIEAWMHDDFLAAVSQNFPIDPSLEFIPAGCWARLDNITQQTTSTKSSGKSSGPSGQQPQTSSRHTPRRPKANKSQHKASKLNPMARTFVPGERMVTITGHAAGQTGRAVGKGNGAIKKPRRGRTAASPHRKWERPGAGHHSDIDMLIKKASN